MTKIKFLFILTFLFSHAALCGQESENRFIPESAFALVDVDVKQIKQQFIHADGTFVSEYFPSEIFTTMGETYQGFDYMLLRRIRVVVAEGKDSLAELRVGVVYEFDEAADIGAKFESQEPISEIDGVPVFMDADFGLECMQLDETTVLHATPDFMSELVKARNVSTPLTALLDASTAKGSEVLGVMSFDQIKDKYAALVDKNPIPEPLNFLNAAPRFFKSAEFRVADHKMTLVMLSEDENSAKKLQASAKRLVGLGKESLKENFMNMGMGGDPVGDSMEAYMRRVVELMAAELTPVKEDNRVTMELKTDAAWVMMFLMLQM